MKQIYSLEGFLSRYHYGHGNDKDTQISALSLKNTAVAVCCNSGPHIVFPLYLREAAANHGLRRLCMSLTSLDPFLSGSFPTVFLPREPSGRHTGRTCCTGALRFPGTWGPWSGLHSQSPSSAGTPDFPA